MKVDESTIASLTNSIEEVFLMERGDKRSIEVALKAQKKGNEVFAPLPFF
jgi:hypothetical protein